MACLYLWHDAELLGCPSWFRAEGPCPECGASPNADKAIGRFDESLQRLCVELKAKSTAVAWDSLQTEWHARQFFIAGPLLRSGKSPGRQAFGARSIKPCYVSVAMDAPMLEAHRELEDEIPLRRDHADGAFTDQRARE